MPLQAPLPAHNPLTIQPLNERRSAPSTRADATGSQAELRAGRHTQADHRQHYESEGFAHSLREARRKSHVDESHKSDTPKKTDSSDDAQTKTGARANADDRPLDVGRNEQDGGGQIDGAVAHQGEPDTSVGGTEFGQADSDVETNTSPPSDLQSDANPDSPFVGDTAASSATPALVVTPSAIEITTQTSTALTAADSSAANPATHAIETNPATVGESGPRLESPTAQAIWHEQVSPKNQQEFPSLPPTNANESNDRRESRSERRASTTVTVAREVVDGAIDENRFTKPAQDTESTSDATVTRNSESSPEAKAKTTAARWTIAAHGRQSDVDTNTPATARARQIDEVVRAENVTGQTTAVAIDGSESEAAQSSPNKPRAVAILEHGASQNQRVPLSVMNLGDDVADTPSFASQAIRGLTAMLNQRGGAMTLRLDPPELGSLRVQMTLVGGNVSAEFTAGSTQTQALLDRHMFALRQSLESQGLVVDRLSVHAAAASSSAQQSAMRNEDGNANAQQHHQQSNSQHNAAGGESRGRRDQTYPQPNQSNMFIPEAWSFSSLMDESSLSSTFAGAAT